MRFELARLEDIDCGGRHLAAGTGSMGVRQDTAGRIGLDFAVGMGRHTAQGSGSGRAGIRLGLADRSHLAPGCAGLDRSILELGRPVAVGIAAGSQVAGSQVADNRLVEDSPGQVRASRTGSGDIVGCIGCRGQTL